MDAKVFSLQEANSLIPAVSEIFRKVFLLNDSIKSANTDIELLLDIWGDGVYDPRHTDNLYYARRVRLRDDSKKELQRSVDELQGLGCVIKDLRQGLLDFHYNKDGEIVFLCWKFGEDRVRYWHRIPDGFGGRRPVEELLQAKTQ